jgi:integrase/recombinase XerD
MAHAAIPFDDDLVESWEIHLIAERKSPRTINLYLYGLHAYAKWCRARELPLAVSRHQFAAYLAELIQEERLADSTVASRHITVRQFSAWLADEEGLDDPLLAVKSPKINEKVTPPFTAEQLADLFAACKGVTFRDRRDEALCRLMAEAGPRAAGVLSMTVAGTDIRAGTAVIRAKGGDEYLIGFGAQTARALDRYLRMRKAHRLAASDVFWLGDRGATFGYMGLYKALNARADAAGITGFHPHRFRHTFSDRWLDKGGSEGGLMAVAGWKSRKMVDRYAKARATARALDEAKRLELGDL